MHTRIILFKFAYIALVAFSLWTFIESMASVSISAEMKDRAIVACIFMALLARIAQAQYHSDRALAHGRSEPPPPPGSRSDQT